MSSSYCEAASNGNICQIVKCIDGSVLSHFNCLNILPTFTLTLLLVVCVFHFSCNVYIAIEQNLAKRSLSFQMVNFRQETNSNIG